jgi:hypothetical protein
VITLVLDREGCVPTVRWGRWVTLMNTIGINYLVLRFGLKLNTAPVNFVTMSLAFSQNLIQARNASQLHLSLSACLLPAVFHSPVLIVSACSVGIFFYIHQIYGSIFPVQRNSTGQLLAKATGTSITEASPSSRNAAPIHDNLVAFVLWFSAWQN